MEGLTTGPLDDNSIIIEYIETTCPEHENMRRRVFVVDGEIDTVRGHPLDCHGTVMPWTEIVLGKVSHKR